MFIENFIQGEKESLRYISQVLRDSIKSGSILDNVSNNKIIRRPYRNDSISTKIRHSLYWIEQNFRKQRISIQFALRLIDELQVDIDRIQHGISSSSL